MLRHVEHLFGGYLDGCHEGKIELAWCDGKDGKLKHAAIFGTDELDELVERAVQDNRIPGQNVYIGQALRKPDIPPFGRCTDADFFALLGLLRRHRRRRAEGRARAVPAGGMSADRGRRHRPAAAHPGADAVAPGDTGARCRSLPAAEPGARRSARRRHDGGQPEPCAAPWRLDRLAGQARSRPRAHRVPSVQ